MPTVDRHLTVALTVEQCWHPVPGGSGTYIVELSRALAALPDAPRLLGLTARHPAGSTPVTDLAPTADRHHASRLPRALLYEAWNRLPGPRVERLCSPDRPDVLHATTWAVPRGRTPLVVTVHDLAFLQTPEHFTPRGAGFFRRSLQRVLQDAAAVVVPSATTRDDCLAVGFESSRVHVVPHGIRAAPPEESAIERFRRAHGLDRPYILWCGTREPRKNLRTLLQAFQLLRDPDLDLVLVGPQGWGDLALPEGSAEEGRVHWLGRLTDRDLACAYAGARLFCYPSLSEGFGLPVLEAMAHGIPVVTSRGTSMAEITGPDGLLVDPRDAGELAEALLRAAGPEHDSLASAALIRSARFTWEQAAADTLSVYRSVL